MNRKNHVIGQKQKSLRNYQNNEVAHFHQFIIGMRKINQYPLHCIGNMDETPLNLDIMTDRKGWMDENGMKLRIENIWNRRPGGIRKERSPLIWDMFRRHITENSKARLSRTNTDIAVVPAGLTSLP